MIACLIECFAFCCTCFSKPVCIWSQTSPKSAEKMRSYLGQIWNPLEQRLDLCFFRCFVLVRVQTCCMNLLYIGHLIPPASKCLGLGEVLCQTPCVPEWWWRQNFLSLFLFRAIKLTFFKLVRTWRFPCLDSCQIGFVIWVLNNKNKTWGHISSEWLGDVIFLSVAAMCFVLAESKGKWKHAVHQWVCFVKIFGN